MARICVVRQLYYPRDEKLRREIDTLLEAGHEVDLFCMRDDGEPSTDRREALTVRRLPLAHRRGKIARYLAEYAAFHVLATLAISVYHLRRRYALVQVNTPPDSLVFSSIVPRLFGAKVLLQLTEPMPEFFATKFKLSPTHLAVRFVATVEQLSLRYADLAIACTEHMRAACIGRGALPEKIAVVTVASDESVFDVTRYPGRARESGRYVLISHGTIEERYGLDTAVRAVSLLRDEIPGLRLRIFGTGSYRETVRSLAADLGVSDNVEFSRGWVPVSDLLAAIADADVGLVAMKRDAFRDLTHNLKMYDFVTMRKPAIVSRTRSVDDYFDDDCFRKFQADDEHDLARAIRDLYADRTLGDRLVARATEVNEPYRWRHQREMYLDVVTRLVAHQPVQRHSVAQQRCADSSFQDRLDA